MTNLFFSKLGHFKQRRRESVSLYKESFILDLWRSWILKDIYIYMIYMAYIWYMCVCEYIYMYFPSCYNFLKSGRGILWYQLSETFEHCFSFYVTKFFWIRDIGIKSFTAEPGISLKCFYKISIEMLICDHLFLALKIIDK